MQARHLEKATKYSELTVEGKKNGWKVIVRAVEVGARGYTSGSFRSTLRFLGLKNSKIRKILKDV